MRSTVEDGVFETYLPAAHPVHTAQAVVELVVALNVPGTHAAHTRSDVALGWPVTWPPTQLVYGAQLAALFGTAVNVPVPQAVHVGGEVGVPKTDAYCPGVQLAPVVVQLAAFVVELYESAGHAVQVWLAMLVPAAETY